MLIQCTKKLLEQLDVTVTSGVEGEPLFSWHANLFIINRRKTLVLVNDLTRYAVVLYGLKGKDFKKIDELMVEAIRVALHEEGIKEEVIESYLNHSQKVTFTKTKDRTHVSRMNKACDYVHSYSRNLDPLLIFQPRVGKLVSMFIVGDGKNRYLYPYEEMHKRLEDFAGQPIFGSRAVQLKVTLRLGGQSVWRRLVVPLHRTFDQLHDILQVAFGWRDCHLHEFTFYDKGEVVQASPSNHLFGHLRRPMLTLVCHHEAFSYPVQHEMKLETGITLSEYLPAHQVLTYTYDFGDDWKHEIVMEKMIEDYGTPNPICLEGQGNTPPEDVGGSYGYKDFLSIIANPNHPDYKHILQWGKRQGYEEFDLEQVNRSLKRT